MKLTDNDRLESKLGLRRYMLQRYPGPHRVFDACQGSGVIWTRLRREFELGYYWGVDTKPRAGRLKIDSRRLLSAGVDANVVDIDTYGSPWGHYAALLPSIEEDTTVFLTVGRVMHSGLDDAGLRALGADRAMLPSLPPTFRGLLVDLAIPYAVHEASRFGLTVGEFVEGLPRGRSARYFGVRLNVRET